MHYRVRAYLEPNGKRQRDLVWQVLVVCSDGKEVGDGWGAFMKGNHALLSKPVRKPSKSEAFLSGNPRKRMAPCFFKACKKKQKKNNFLSLFSFFPSCFHGEAHLVQLCLVGSYPRGHISLQPWWFFFVRSFQLNKR